MVATLNLNPLNLVRADTLTPAAAVNIAGRQRMLTQRITKSYLQIGLGARVEEAEEQRRRALALFADQHAQLEIFGGSTEVALELGSVASVWKSFKDAAGGEIDKSTALSLVDMDEKLLHACEELVHLIENTAGIARARIVNTSGRQRMLSQRIAKFYMLQASGLARPSDLDKMDSARNQFEGALEVLREYPGNTPLIKHTLEDVSQQWLWMEASIDMAKEHLYPVIVADASEKILVLTEKVTALYEELAEDR